MKLLIDRLSTPKVLLLSFFTISLFSGATQTLYRYEDLSRQAYAIQKDSIKKNWVCPTVYSPKNTQKKYRELWDSRTNYITSAIANQAFVNEPEIQAYLQGIVSTIVKSNPKLITATPLLLIDRNASVNAYAVGRNLLAVNLGLISFVQSREELALVLAHELAHNVLDHPDRSMREAAEWFTSAEYEQSLKDVMNAKYERYSKLKKVFEGYSLTNSRHHRYHESDADSLAIVLLRNSGIGFDARFFLRLDSADLTDRTPLAQPVGNYFTAYGLSFENSWTAKRTKGLSTRNYSFSDTAKLNDSLKTHPDCEQRYRSTLKHTTPNLKLTELPVVIRQKATKMLIWNLYDNMRLTAALYRILQEKDKGSNDPWFDFMISNIIGGLSHAENTLRRFNAIGIVPKEQVCKSYYELQTALEQMPGAALRNFYTGLQGKSFWQQLPADAIGMRSMLHDFITATDVETTQKRAAENFIKTYKGSMYCEFAEHFAK